MCKIRKISFARIIRPMKMTFATALGSKTSAKSVIVKAVLENGQFGIGEVPTSFAFKNETIDAIKNVLGRAREKLTGMPIDDYSEFIRKFRKIWAQFPMTVSGLEVALFRAWLTNQNKNEFSYWCRKASLSGGGKKKIIETDITIPYIPQDDLERWLKIITKKGFKIYKIKTSGNVAKDFKFVKGINEVLTENIGDFAVRLDGNQGYTQQSCLKMLDELQKAKIKIELFEQPLKKDDFKGLKNLSKRSATPIIADETVFSPQDCERVAGEKLAHGINIKIAKSGIAGAEEILQIAEEAGLKVMIGCMTETMVGLSAAIYLAAGTAAFDYIDLDSIHFFSHWRRYGNITILDNRYEIEAKRNEQ